VEIKRGSAGTSEGRAIAILRNKTEQFKVSGLRTAGRTAREIQQKGAAEL